MQRLQRLNLSPQIINGIDINPVTRKQVKLYGDTFNLGHPLDPDELDIFKAQFATLLAAPGSEERKLMLDRLPQYVIALRAIKNSLNGVKFAGINPEDTELGFGHIRPQFTHAGVATYKYTWVVVLAALAAWTDWLFEAAGAPYAVGRDFGLCVTHLKSLVTPNPFISEARFVVGRTGQLIPIDTRALRMADTENNVAIIPIPSMILIPQASFYAQAKSDLAAASTEEVALGGLIIGLGRVLKEAASAAAPATWV